MTEEQVQQTQKYHVVDASGLILGRMASVIAKRLLLGEKIVIVNAEKAVISGKPRSIIEEYKDMFKKRTATNPTRGPLYPRMPDRLVRRTVRGMLPMKKPRGQTAYKRLRVFIGTPEQYAESEKETIPQADGSHVEIKLSVGELAKELGWLHYDTV